MRKLTTKTKIILISTFTTLTVLIFGITIYNQIHSATLLIQIAPLDATVTINGQEYSNGSFRIAPKTQAEVTITAPEFKTKTLTLDIKSHEVTKLVTYLIPEDNDWRPYKELDNKDSLSTLLYMNGYQPWDLFQISSNLTTDQDSSADSLINTISIRTLTPFSFSICSGPASRTNCNAISIKYDYYLECGNTLCLAITGRGANLNDATLATIREKLAERGYNFDNYEYFYTQELERLPDSDNNQL